MLVDVLRRAGVLAAHLDTRDDRSLATVERFDFQNVWLGLRHVGQLIRLLARHRDADVYLPISQGLGGFLRDSLFLLAARVARRRTYIHLHGGSFQDFYRGSPAPLRWYMRRLLRGVHEAWVLTGSLTGAFDGLIGRERIRVIENAVPDVPAARAGAADANGEFRLLYLANLFPTKGCLDVLDAVESLGDRAAGWRVRLVGWADAAVQAEVTARAGRLAPRGVRVEAPGPLTGAEKAAEFAAADAFVFPSRYPPEGQPLVLLEALAAGLPIVSTRHAGIPDTVRDGEDGVLVERGDIAAIAGALARLAGDHVLRERLGRNGRRRYEERYVPERFARDVLAAVGPTRTPSK